MKPAPLGSVVVLLSLLPCAAVGAEPGSPAADTFRPASPAAANAREGPPPLDEADSRIEILAYVNGDASPWAEFFTFDSPGHPKLERLRTEYKLQDLVKPAKTDLERAMILKRWVKANWKFTKPAPDAFLDWSAVTLLDRAKQGKYGWCGQAAMIFQQACMSVGLPARFIELGQPHTPACHFTTEVFLREHDKWAVIDPTPLPEADLYYTVDNVPQSALEMHRRVVTGKMEDVVQVHADGPRKVQSRDDFAWVFYYVRWLTRCDVVTNTPKFVDMENTFDRRWHTVEWTDTDTVPWEKQKHATYYMRNERLSAWTTSDPEDLYWSPTDRVRIAVRTHKNYVFFQLWSADLDFDHFEVAIDGGEWQRLPEGNVNFDPQYGWSPKRFSIPAESGDHEVRVRLVRHVGSRGPESFVKLRVK